MDSGIRRNDEREGFLYSFNKWFFASLIPRASPGPKFRPKGRGIQPLKTIKLLHEAIVKLPFFVTPAKAGVFNPLNDRDSCFRRNDNQAEKVNFAIASHKN